MQPIAQHAPQPLPVESGAPALPAPLQHRPLPRPARPSRLMRALRWLFRLLFVQPVGRRARAERLRALPDRTLRDIGLRRADVQAAASDLVWLCDSCRPIRAPGRSMCAAGQTFGPHWYGSGTPPDSSLKGFPIGGGFDPMRALVAIVLRACFGLGVAIIFWLGMHLSRRSAAP